MMRCSILGCIVVIIFGCCAQSANPYIKVLHQSTPIIVDQFKSLESSPIASPRTAQPGPGSWTVDQTDGTFQIVNDVYSGEVDNSGPQLKYTAQSTPIEGDLAMVSASSILTNAGLAAVGRIRMTSGNTLSAGFERSSVSSFIDGAALSFSFLTVVGRFGGLPISSWCNYSLNNDYEFAVILRPVGAYLMLRGGGNSQYPYAAPSSGFFDWTLVWVDNSFSDSSVYAAFHNEDAGGYLGGFTVEQLYGSDWNDPYHLSTFRKATTANADTGTMTPDAIVEHTITASTGVTQELRVRAQDASNAWIVRMDQAGSTIKLIELVSGVETERKSAAAIWNNGTQYRISVMCNKPVFAVYIGNTIALTRYVSDGGFMTQTGVSVSHAGSNLVCWNMHPPIPDYVSRTTKGIMCVGDSKTDGGVDSETITGGMPGYERYLVDGLNTNNCVEYIEMRNAHGGYTVGQIKAAIDSDLSMAYGNATYALINMGANNVENPLDVNYSSDYGYVLDAIHAKWPACKIYCMRIWRRSTSNLTLQANAVASVVSARPSFCFLGPDERVFLENADNGATYTTDGIHPNHAGHLLTAAQWRTVLGL